MMASSAKLVGRIVGTSLLAPGRKEEKEKEEEKEGEKGNIINIKMGNIKKDKMNYAIFDNNKILSQKIGNAKEERRKFYKKKKDIENKKRNNYVASKYKNMMMKRKEYDMVKENEKDTKMNNESNKTRLKNLTPKCLGVISFKHKVRKQYRGSCKGNVVAYPPFRDNG